MQSITGICHDTYCICAKISIEQKRQKSVSFSNESLSKHLCQLLLDHPDTCLVGTGPSLVLSGIVSFDLQQAKMVRSEHIKGRNAAQGERHLAVQPRAYTQ